KTVRDEGRNAILTLDVEGDEPLDVMLHDYQTDPVSKEVQHIDFYIVNLTEEMDVEVTVNLIGEAVGSKEGGMVQQPSYELQNIDFYIVNVTEYMDVEVTVNLIGEAVGSKEGVIVQQPSYELQVRAMPRDIPEEINVNIDELDIGDSISVSDLPVSDLYEFLDDEDTTIVTVLPPEEEEEETDEEVDLSVEPELVGADEDEDEEDEEN